MKISKQQLEKLISESLNEAYDEVERYQNAYVKMVLEALRDKTSHLLKDGMLDLSDPRIQKNLAYIIGSHLFNHSEKLPKQFNPKD